MLNVIVDESTDITTRTIMNMSVHTQNSVFQYASESIGGKRHKANATKELIIVQI
jgi:hypothetical protein